MHLQKNSCNLNDKSKVIIDWKFHEDRSSINNMVTISDVIRTIYFIYAKASHQAGVTAEWLNGTRWYRYLIPLGSCDSVLLQLTTLLYSVQPFPAT